MVGSWPPGLHRGGRARGESARIRPLTEVTKTHQGFALSASRPNVRCGSNSGSVHLHRLHFDVLVRFEMSVTPALYVCAQGPETRTKICSIASTPIASTKIGAGHSGGIAGDD